MLLCDDNAATVDDETGRTFTVLADGRRRASLHVRMRDGVRIALSIWLPPAPAKPAPTVVHFTRYWRERLYDGPAPTAVNPGDERVPIASWGYAYVSVDARGTGASFGSRRVELPQDEVLDSSEVIAWIAEQPWSNGRVATMGISYVANTALMAATVPAPALKAVIARAVDIDMYEDLIAPGGLPNAMFVDEWGEYVRRLDRGDASVFGPSQSGVRITGVAPVDADLSGALLREAIAEHGDNIYVPAEATDIRRSALYRDAFFAGQGGEERPSIAGRLASLSRHAVPTAIWASWMDAGTASGALRWFTQCDAPGEVVIGAWGHGAGQDGDPFREPYSPPDPLHADQLVVFRSFLDAHLWSDRAPSSPRRVSYVTMNGDGWRQTSVWPPSDTRVRTLELGPAGELAEVPAAGGRSDYAVDFEAGAGRETRWTTQLGGPVAYRDRREATQRLLRFTTPPLEAGIRLVGAPVLSVVLAPTRDDLALIAYLDDVDPEGRVTYLTEGPLRLLHRPDRTNVASEPSDAPGRSFAAADARPLRVGDPERFVFALLPTAVSLKAGHRLQLSLAGGDKDTFIRVPAEGDVGFSVLHDPASPSTLTLTVGGGGAGEPDLLRLLGVAPS